VKFFPTGADSAGRRGARRFRRASRILRAPRRNPAGAGTGRADAACGLMAGPEFCPRKAPRSDAGVAAQSGISRAALVAPCRMVPNRWVGKKAEKQKNRTLDPV